MSLSKLKPPELELGMVLGSKGHTMTYQAMWNETSKKSREVAAKKVGKHQIHEKDLLSRLDHKNIVKLLTVIDEDPDIFLVLELCPGGSLRDYLDQCKNEKKRLPAKEFFDWAKQAGRPIEYLRSIGVVHNGIKSQSYVIDANQTLKLTDFGMAKSIKTANLIPESENGTSASNSDDPLTAFTLSKFSDDVFAYGVVLWELWTTDASFKGGEEHAVIWKAYYKKTPIPLDCPKSVAEVMRQCLEIDRRKRPSIEHVMNVVTEADNRRRQILEGPWEMEKEFEGLKHSFGVAVNINGDVAIAEYTEANEVKIFNEEGDDRFNLYMKDEEELCAKSFPWDIAVNSKGTYYITDISKYVRMYDINAQFKGKWMTFSPDKKSATSRNTVLKGIAIDMNEHLFVGETKQNFISKHKPDGSHIKTIKVHISPWSLAVTSRDNIVISDWLVKSVHIVDNTGRLLHVMSPGNDVELWEPWGITCYNDVICICNYATKCISCFFLSGEYLGSIPLDIPNHPRCVTLTNDGKKLLVTYGWATSGEGLAMFKLTN